MEIIGEHRSFAGIQYICQHQAQSTRTPMTFAAYVPDQAQQSPAPVLFYLSGLTCTHANVMEKGEYRHARAQAFTSLRPRRHGRRTTACGAMSPRNFRLS